MRLGRVGIVVAARTQSSRLPGKALLPLQGMPIILFLMHRLASASRGRVVLATTDLAADDSLAALVAAAGVPVFRGADADVVSRYVAAAQHFGFDSVARVTGDCPFVDGELVDGCLAQAEALDKFDLATTKGRFPVGLDVEIYAANAMAELDAAGLLSGDEREHLTLHFYRHPDLFAVRTFEPPSDWGAVERHFTVDTHADYQAAEALAGGFDGARFSVTDLLRRAAV